MTSQPTPRRFIAALISSIQTAEDTSSDRQSANLLKDAPRQIQNALLTLHVSFPNELLPALDLLDRGLITRFRLQHEAQVAPDSGPPLQQLPREQFLRDEDPGPEELGQVSGLHSLRHLRQQHEIQVDLPLQAASESTRRQGAHDRGVQGVERQDQTLHHERSATDHSPANNTRHAQVYVVRSGQLSSRVRVLNHTASYEVRLDAWSCSCPAFAFSSFPAAPLENDSNQQLTYENLPDSLDANWKFGGLTLGSDLPICKHLLACALVEHSSVFARSVVEQDTSVEELAGWAAGWGD